MIFNHQIIIINFEETEMRLLLKKEKNCLYSRKNRCNYIFNIYDLIIFEIYNSLNNKYNNAFNNIFNIINIILSHIKPAIPV